MIERTPIRIATAAGARAGAGAAWWLARVMFSRTERRKLDAATQAMDTASFKGVDGLDYATSPRGEENVTALRPAAWTTCGLSVGTRAFDALIICTEHATGERGPSYYPPPSGR